MLTSAVRAALLVSLALAAPAGAQTAPVFKRVQTYFTCAAPTKVHNGTAMGLSTTPPDVSFEAGAGCGFVEPGPLSGPASGDSTLDAVFAGTFTGPVRNLVVELRELVAGTPEHELAGTSTFDVVLTIDGKDVVRPVPGRPVVSPTTGSPTNTNHASMFTVDLTGLALTEDVQRSFRLTVRRAGSTAPIGGWVAGALEVPSGITFNAREAVAPVLAAG